MRFFTDGAARGNLGPAGAGAVIVSPAGHIMARRGARVTFALTSKRDLDERLAGSAGFNACASRRSAAPRASDPIAWPSLVCSRASAQVGFEVAMDDRRRCGTVLLVNEDREFLDVAGDALRAQGLAVLLVPGFDRALAAMRSGFRPDVILVDLAPGPSQFASFLRALFEEPAWRGLPVLGSSDAGMFQIAPRHQQRKLPVPSAPSQLAAVLEVVCAEVDRPEDDLPAT